MLNFEPNHTRGRHKINSWAKATERQTITACTNNRRSSQRDLSTRAPRNKVPTKMPKSHSPPRTWRPISQPPVMYSTKELSLMISQLTSLAMPDPLYFFFFFFCFCAPDASEGGEVTAEENFVSGSLCVSAGVCCFFGGGREGDTHDLRRRPNQHLTVADTQTQTHTHTHTSDLQQTSMLMTGKSRRPASAI